MIASLLFSALAFAQTPSLCDKYTTAVFTNNSEENQLKLLTAVVNTVVIGNYSASATGQRVAGILAPGTQGGETINLLGYFDGTLNTSNVGGRASKVNFLDGGAAAPLALGQASTNVTSKQQFLMDHLYQAFGSLLGCSKQGL
jgi:hypothetical protein